MTSLLAGFRGHSITTPEADAVRLGDQCLSYAMLDRRAAGLAAALRARGVTQGRPVLIGMGRTPGFIVAMLAAARCAAVAVPIDPTLPAERIDAIIDAAGPAALVAPADTGIKTAAPLIATDPMAETWDAGADLPFPPDDPDRSAVLLFTSGSTGRPKGIELTAGNLAAGARSFNHDRPDAGARTLMFGAAGVVTTSIECTMALAAGNCIVMIDEATRHDPVALLRCLADQRVTRALIPVSPLLAMAEVAAVQPVPLALRHLMAGAEPLRVSPALRAFVASQPGLVFVNTYGSTEAGPTARFVMPPDPADWPATPPIGTPWPGVTCLVTAPDLTPLPDGETGELVVLGPAVSGGYWGQPSLTAERFVPRLPGQPPGTGFRVGDSVRRVPTGELHWIGRVDDQIKIAGHRIEPAEVEAVLLEHADIGQAAVAAQEGANGALQLAGFVVARPGRRLPDWPALRAHLAARLPPPMIPSLWRALDDLPRLPGGKLNRAALRHIQVTAPVTATDTPESATEVALAPLLATVLSVPAVGRQDDFFDLGGDSLRAMELVAVAHHAGLPLSSADVFEGRTLAGIAAKVTARADARPTGASDVVAVPLNRAAAGDAPPLIFIHAIGGMVFNYVPLAIRLPGWRCLGIQGRGLEPGEQPDLDFDLMLADYARAIRAAVGEGPYRLYGYSFGGVIAHQLFRLLRPTPDPRDLLILGDSFDPAEPGAQPRTLDDVLTAGLEGTRPILARLVRPVLSMLPRALKLTLGRRSLRRFLANEREALAWHRLSNDLVERIVATWLAGAGMIARLRCPPHPVRSVLLRATELLPGHRHDTRPAWRALTGDLTVIDVPGNHYTMMAPANATALAAIFDRVLHDAAGATGLKATTD